MAKPADHRDDGLPAYKPQNYHRLAEIMSMDNNFAIFRRFEDLNMLNLMALQAELLELRGLFRDQCRRDDESNPGSGEPQSSVLKLFPRTQGVGGWGAAISRNTQHAVSIFPTGTDDDPPKKDG